MRILGAADETHRGHPKTVAVHALFGGGNQFRMIGETQVVIRAEVDNVASVRDGDISLLGRSNNTLFFIQPFRTCGLKVVIQLLVKIRSHCNSPD